MEEDPEKEESTRIFSIITKRRDLETMKLDRKLVQLVKERYSASRPEGFDLMLWGDLHTLFEPDEDDDIWKDQHEYKLLSWRLYDFCGIHILLMENGLAIHMLTEKKYPLSQEMISKMLKKKLEVDHESSQAIELLRYFEINSFVDHRDDRMINALSIHDDHCLQLLVLILTSIASNYIFKKSLILKSCLQYSLGEQDDRDGDEKREHVRLRNVVNFFLTNFPPKMEQELQHIWSCYNVTYCKVKYMGGSIFSLEFRNKEEDLDLNQVNSDSAKNIVEIGTRSKVDEGCVDSIPIKIKETYAITMESGMIEKVVNPGHFLEKSEST
ncbi:hypothetical protein Tco_0624167 [Tanacetum coccineum]|uniref:Uncharacterized protein n=1 Tax=Tanacetum coccineum TaxID=301880 RepID=A0ABQ4WD36_9ASTR